MGENPKINCPNCGEEIVIILKEFVDVEEDPIYKDQILNGTFFLASCSECGDTVMVEYPVMYMDKDRKLNVYMAPEHSEDLLDQLNSVEIPEEDIDESAVFRVVSSSTGLVEKILICDNNRDDRVLELYKAVVCENIKDEWPDVDPSDLLYMKSGEEEFFIIWSMQNENGENLTVEIDNDLYEELKENYMEALKTEPNKYAEVDHYWIMDRVEE